MINAEVVEKGQKNYMHCYGSYPIAFKSGKGCYLVDEDGKEYLDCVAGIAVNALGYGDKELVEAIKKQLDTGLIHTSNLYYNALAVNAAEKLNKIAGSEEVFFCNSGAEANEAALKMARKYGSSKNKSKILSMAHSFHGRTYGAITVTGQDKYHKGFFPLLPDVAYATFNDLESVEKEMTDDVCAVIVEPIQGEGGVITADKAFLEGVRKLATEKDVLLIFDEVQCGMGRSGYPFAFQMYGVTPDILTTAKALGGGIPMGACIAFSKAKGIFEPGNHASTFGGNYIAATGANVVLDRLMDGKLLENVKDVGSYLGSKLEMLVRKYPKVCVEARGAGLMRGVQITIKPSELVSKCMEKGLLVASAGYDVLRFVPPLIISKEEIDKAISIVEESIEELTK